MKGQKTDGRQKGTPNKVNVYAAEKLAAVGCDPILGMATIAMDANAPSELRGCMYAELAQYVGPKRRTVDYDVANSQIAGFVIIGMAEAAGPPAWRAEHDPNAPKELPG